MQAIPTLPLKKIIVTKDELTTLTYALSTGLGGGLVALYAAWRKIRGDQQHDRVADSTHMHSNALIEYYKREAQEHAALAEQRLVTIERVSQERNEAVQQLGALKATVEHLSEQVEALQAENRELKSMVAAMTAVNNQILAKLQVMEEREDDKA